MTTGGHRSVGIVALLTLLATTAVAAQPATSSEVVTELRPRPRDGRGMDYFPARRSIILAGGTGVAARLVDGTGDGVEGAEEAEHQAASASRITSGSGVGRPVRLSTQTSVALTSA